MGHQQIVEIVREYAEKVNGFLPVKMIILERNYPGEENNPHGVIEVAIVLERLRDEDDYIDLKLKLGRLAEEVSPRIDTDIIDLDKKDPVGFYNQIRKTGEVIYQRD